MLLYLPDASRASSKTFSFKVTLFHSLNDIQLGNLLVILIISKL